MRLFVAIDLSALVAAAALDLISQLQSTAAAVAPQSRITWMTIDRLHVTIRFIGQVDAAKTDAIRSALTPSLALDPFALTIAGVGTFPARGQPRVVWAGLTAGREQLSAVERLVSERLAAVGVAPEDRPYSPHLTLARVRDAAGLRSAALVGGLRDRTVGTTSVDAITLFESRLSAKGPNYVALQRTALQSS